MDFYLLDTNIFSNLYNLRRDKYSDVCSAIGALDPDAPQYLSVVVLGELLFGLRMVEGAGQDLNHIRTTIKRAEERPLAEIGLHTAEAYGEVRYLLARHWTDTQRKLPRWVEDWKDKVTGKSLQIDENDLWLVAQAIERNYVFLTTDKKLAARFRPAVPDLRLNLI